MKTSWNTKPWNLRAWWLARSKRRAIRQLPKFLRPQAKFRARYPKYEVGVGTYGIPNVHDWDEGSMLRIGAYCSIAEDVTILLGGGHRTDWISCYPFPRFIEEATHIPHFGSTRGDVVIGNDVWLGMGCTILSGVRIGDGAVVGARAVVTRDVEPYSIVAGNPARMVRWRFDDATRAALMTSLWWYWPEDEIRQNAHLLCSDRLSDFLDYARARVQRAAENT